MKLLAQHPEFRDLIQNTAGGIQLRPELVLKDYWVTAALRVLAVSEFRGRFLFKGGTSLSKGWKLIDRFSEDIDLLLTGPDFTAPPDRKGEREKLMKATRDCISAKLPLVVPDLKNPHFYRRDDWHMEAHYVWDPAKVESATVEETVFLEAGFRGGANPFTQVALNSMVGDFILGQKLEGQESLREYRDDFTPFLLELLSPARTFFEKVLHIHTCLRGDVSKLKTRHIYDVVQIFRHQPEVRDLVVSGDFHPLLQEAIEVSNQWYGAGLNPADVKLHESLVMSGEQVQKLSAAYVQDAVYYYRGQPPFDDLQQRLEEIRTAFAK